MRPYRQIETLVLLFLCLVSCQLQAQNVFMPASCVSKETAEPADRLSDDFVRTSLMIAAHGDVLYSILGHICFRLQCPAYGLDYCFSYESENVAHRVGRFLTGDLKMGMFAIPTEEYLQMYADEKRGVWEYPMNLPPKVKQSLWRVLDEHIMEGTSLPYDYIHRGCAIACVHILHEALDTIPIIYAPFSEDLKHCTMRELFYNNSPHSWNLFFCMTLVGGEVDKQFPPEEKLIVPADLVRTWQTAKVEGEPLLAEQIELLSATPRKECPVSPVWVFAFLLLLAVGNLWITSQWVDYGMLTLQTLMGLLMTYLVLFSSLPGTEWNWLIIPFNPFPALFWHWRKYWALGWSVVLGVWCVVMFFAPHRLVCCEHILWVLSFILILIKPKLQQWIVRK